MTAVPAARPTAASRHRTSGRSRLLLLIPLMMLVGCRSLRPSDGEGIFAARNPFSTESIRGPLERAFNGDEDPLTKGQKFSAAGRKQVELARKQFEEKQYAKAAKTYKSIAGKYKESAIGEEAWFRIAECHFALQEYPKAQDAYEKLFVDYPSTKYVSDASRRMFFIARTWLEITDPVAKEQIRTVSSSELLDETGISPEDKSAPQTAKASMAPNFFDKTRPFIDTNGRALKALKAIWLNDPTGPLADDALMLTATYYLRKENFIEADRYFEILRDEYPDSPHLENAYVLGAHVKQASYQGPMYDGTTLVSAENLKERTLNLFPNTESRQELRQDLGRIYQLRAQRAWSTVDLWKRKGNPRAVAIACTQVITGFPDTRYAQQAREELRKIDPAVVRGLPEIGEFMRSLPEEVPAEADPEPERPPVKSVGFSRFLPFGK
ncbi:MAG: outer membrane protein assembly factor BamD [Planctomycetaceae bacterium]